MTKLEFLQLKAGDRLRFDDGQPSHLGEGVVAARYPTGALDVKFDDRAESNMIGRDDLDWIDYLTKIAS